MSKIKKKVVEYYSFYCPGCKHQHVYAINDDGTGWQFNGNMESPSFTPSLLNTVKTLNEKTGAYDVEYSRCHLFVTNGKIIYCGDCKHELAGQIVELPDIDSIKTTRNTTENDNSPQKPNLDESDFEGHERDL